MVSASLLRPVLAHPGMSNSTPSVSFFPLDFSSPLDFSPASCSRGRTVRAHVHRRLPLRVLFFLMTLGAACLCEPLQLVRIPLVASCSSPRPQWPAEPRSNSLGGARQGCPRPAIYSSPGDRAPLSVPQPPGPSYTTHEPPRGLGPSSPPP